MVVTQKFLQLQGNGLMEITDLLNEQIAAAGVRQGIAVVQVMSAAEGLFRAPRDDTKVLTDIQKEMRRLVPARITYQNEQSPEQAAGCIKSALFGTGLSCVITEGKLASGEILGVYFAQYDGPGSSTCLLCIMGE